ncbi:MAG: hypothetical protein J1E39_09755 [Eubacterium sp.]|nr:hypothetical protein [Eubacterium sp.]
MGDKKKRIVIAIVQCVVAVCWQIFIVVFHLILHRMCAYDEQLLITCFITVIASVVVIVIFRVPFIFIAISEIIFLILATFFLEDQGYVFIHFVDTTSSFFNLDPFGDALFVTIEKFFLDISIFAIFKLVCYIVKSLKNRLQSKNRE